jgi:tetratricopeptide (TPR) repeat protein
MMSRLRKPVFAMAIAGVLAMAGGTMSNALAQMPAPKVSTENAKALQEAQAALNAKKYPDAVAKARAILAAPKRTKDDTFVAYQFLLQAAQARNDSPGMTEALEGQIASGFVPESATGALYRPLVGLAYRDRNYAKVIDYGQRLIRSGDANPDIYQWVGQAFYEQKNYKEAVRFFDSVVTEKEKRGQKPARNDLVQLQSAQAKVGNKDAAQNTLEKIVRFYPDSSTWLALLYDVKRERLDPPQKLLLYRLMNATGNLKQAQDFFAYAEAALAEGLPAESQKALEAGLKSNAFPVGSEKDRADRYYKSASTRATAQQAELAKLEAAAKAAGTGDKLVELGLTHFSFGQYAKAVDTIKAGLAKGSVADRDDAQAALGVAQVSAGQKGEAVKTFRATTSDDEVTQSLLKLWTLYAS